MANHEKEKWFWGAVVNHLNEGWQWAWEFQVRKKIENGCRDRNYFWRIGDWSWHLMVTALRQESSLASSSVASGAMVTVSAGVIGTVPAAAAEPLPLAVPLRPTTLANFVVAETAAAITWPLPFSSELLVNCFCISWLEESRRLDSEVCLLLTDCKKGESWLNS